MDNTDKAKDVLDFEQEAAEVTETFFFRFLRIKFTTVPQMLEKRDFS